MKFKILLLIAFILIISSYLTSCYYPGSYDFDDSNYETTDSISQSTGNDNLDNALFLRYPVRDYPIGKNDTADYDNKSCTIYWECSDKDDNYFGNYLGEYGGKTYNGYHGGEDWNLKGEGVSPNEDLGKPVYAIGKGKIIAINKVGTGGVFGNIVVIEHIGSFKIPAWEKKDIQGNIASYSAENDVNKFYSVYLHLENIPNFENEEKNACLALVDEDTILGYIMDPGGGPHLHFEIRKNNDNHSNDWSLAGAKTNKNGYYINLQEMIDAGLRDPSEFIDANSNPMELIKKIQGK